MVFLMDNPVREHLYHALPGLTVIIHANIEAPPPPAERESPQGTTFNSSLSRL